MTLDEFRRNSGYTARLREIFDDPIMQQLLAVLKESNPAIDVPAAAPEVASVRMLSQMTGYQTALSALLSAAEPLVEPAGPAPATWEREEA